MAPLGLLGSRPATLAIAAGLALLVPGVFLWVHARAERRRFVRLIEEVGGLGLEYVPADPFGIREMRFALFTRERWPRCRNYASGRWDGLEVVTFECELTAGRTLVPYACALARLPETLPHVAIRGRMPFGPAVRDPFELRVVRLGARLDRAFRVVAADEAFARELLDEELRAWLLDIGRRWSFEVLDGYALCSTPLFRGRLRPVQPADVLATMASFHAEVVRRRPAGAPS